jgi:hypothetical protein
MAWFDRCIVFLIQTTSKQLCLQNMFLRIPTTAQTVARLGVLRGEEALRMDKQCIAANGHEIRLKRRTGSYAHEQEMRLIAWHTDMQSKALS